MRGIVLSLSALFAVAIVFIAVFIIGLAVSFAATLAGRGQIGQEFEVIGGQQRAFFLAEALAHLFVEDRLFFEHSLAASFTGALESSGSAGVVPELAGFLQEYRLRYARVRITGFEDSEPAAILDVAVSNPPGSVSRGAAIGCGPALEGTCTQGECGEGRVQAEGSCANGVCCKIDLAAYREASGSAATLCGASGEGICTSKRRVQIDPLLGMTHTDNCGPGRTVIESDACPAATDCCALIQDTIETSKARVPLLYKNGDFRGEIEVTVSEG